MPLTSPPRTRVGRIAPSAAIATAAALTAGLFAQGAFAAAKPAVKGKAITIGYINEDAPGAVPTYKGTAETKMAEKWLNDNGGIGGRPVKVVFCSTKGTPESSQACANQMISKKVSVVTKNIDNGWDGAINPLKNANITVLGGLPTQTNEFGAPNAFYLTGGSPTIIIGMSIYALTFEKPTSIAVITSTNPAAKAALPLTLGPLQAAKVPTEVVEVADDAPDFNPAVKTALDKKPSVLIGLLSPQQCVPVMQAMKSQGAKVRMVTTGLCNNEQFFATAGDAADNWVYGEGGKNINVSPDDEQFTLYRDAAKKYQGGKFSKDSDAVYGFTNLLDIASVMAKVDQKVWDKGPKAVQDAIRTYLTSAGATSRFAEAPYECGKSKLFPSVCGFVVSQFLRTAGKLADATGGKPVNAFIG